MPEMLYNGKPLREYDKDELIEALYILGKLYCTEKSLTSRYRKLFSFERGADTRQSFTVADLTRVIISFGIGLVVGAGIAIYRFMAGMM